MYDIQRNFINSELKTFLTCPVCEKSRKVDISKFIDHDKEAKLKCTCSCGTQFSAILERRRSIRKNVSFPGWIVYRGNKTKVCIKDVSKHGVKIFSQENSSPAIGHKMGVEFKIDDPLGSYITRDVRVKKIIGPNRFGCEFITFDHSGKLGKYFLFDF